jgi:hypothetical protein
MFPNSTAMHLPRRELIAIAIALLCAAALIVGCGKSPEQLTDDLLVAARNGDTETVRSLVAKGVNVNARRQPEGWTALHFAASGAHLQIVELLLQAKADANAVGSAGTGISSKPRVVAQAGRAMVDYMKSGKIQIDPSPQGGVQATDADAARRYETIVSLLAAAEAGAGPGK